MLGVLALGSTAIAEDVPLLGSYAVVELTRNSHDVLVSLAVRLENQTDADVRQARMSLGRPEDSAAEAEPSGSDAFDRAFAGFPVADVPAHASLRFEQRLQIPAAEWAD